VDERGAGAFEPGRIRDAGVIRMGHLLTILASLGIVIGLTACCPIQFGAAPPPVADQGNPPPQKPADKPKPPPDPAAVALIEAKGSVKYDETQPDRPVIEVYAPFDKGTDADFKKLSTFKKLRVLRIAQSSGVLTSSISGAGFKELADMKDLEVLRADFCPITDEGVGNIMAFRNLKELGLTHAKFTNAGMKQIATLDKLEVLYMQGVHRFGPGKNEPGDEVMKLLGNCKNLRELDIAHTNAGDATAKALSTQPLKKLKAYNTKFTDAGLADIAKLKLEEAHLGGYEMGDKGVAAFAGQKQMKSLQFAYARGVTDKSVKTLSSLTGLTYLSVFMTSITPQGIDELKKALPNCKVVN
jgi:hypothetical protein